jgi:hypothetical protein
MSRGQKATARCRCPARSGPGCVVIGGSSGPKRPCPLHPARASQKIRPPFAGSWIECSMSSKPKSVNKALDSDASRLAWYRGSPRYEPTSFRNFTHYQLKCRRRAQPQWKVPLDLLAQMLGDVGRAQGAGQGFAGEPDLGGRLADLTSRSAPAQGLPAPLDRTRLSSPQNMLAYAVARHSHHRMEDADEPRQGTRSVWRRRYPSRQRRMLRWAYYGNRARIRLRR